MQSKMTAMQWAIKENGTLTIESGRFKGNISCVQIEEGHLSVNGGNFDLDQKWPSVGNGYDYTLNCIDASYKEGKASVIMTWVCLKKRILL